ncbi:MAG: Gfo/Idh/MocA family oxidoreductase [Kiritimatiellae bacterium]|nr:Gfo/Idh/MocA family oxidoreductase [Kiritimatiellia bacterium]
MKQSDVGRMDGSRRRFLRTAAGAVAAPFVARGPVLGANERTGVGFIGAGGRAQAHMQMVQKLKEEGLNVELVAVADVYRGRREARRRQFPIARDYRDHRELLADPNVDVVCIATPDHHHAPQALDAVAAGKDMYIEKPLSHWRQFELTKRLAEAAKAVGRVITVGCQAMSDPAWRQMKDLVRQGVIGRPLFGEAGFFRVGDWGERGMPVDDPKVKPGPDLDWDAFLGDAPRREFSVDRFFRWRLFEDYAGGPVTDLFPHCLTPVVDVMGATFPDTVTGIGAIHVYPYELREVPDTFNLIASYPDAMTIAVLGTQGNDYTTTPKRGAGQRSPVIRGTEGTLTIEPDNRQIRFTPSGIPGQTKSVKLFPIEGHEDNLEMWRDLIRCHREKNPATMCPMDLAFRVQTVLQMAMLSHKAGRHAKFDQAAIAIRV